MKTNSNQIKIGDKYGNLTCISDCFLVEGRLKAKFKCDCGTDKEIEVRHVLYMRTKTCGAKCPKSWRATHGLSSTRLYRIYGAMIKRCLNPLHKHYPDYGGRGITVCEEWKNDFRSFYDWAINSGYSDDLQIDREDNDGNYEPNNCRFVTCTVNQRNKRNNVFLEGKTRTEWLEFYGLPKTMTEKKRFISRLRKGWPLKFCVDNYYNIFCRNKRPNI